MQFDNRYATLDEKLFHRQPPSPLQQPIAGHFNTQVAAQLNWPQSADWVSILGGQTLLEGFDPLAMAYAGHQFGHWAGQLGDGRGLLLGQVIDINGQLQDLHLKGAGLTPYSRMGDGRAVLRSVIREYLAGHALRNLGVASSSALGFVSSKTPVQREQLERGACLLRVADCHVRLGHFEWINQYQPELLEAFTSKMIDWYYPECKTEAESTGINPVLCFAKAVIQRTAKTISDWQLVGFAHGVMNTDNLSITGSTLDFGPFGFLERFNPAWINNHSDHGGRYTYQNQPSIAHWNLWVWLGQLLPLGLDKEDLQAALAEFEPAFLHHYREGMAKKLGIDAEHPESFDTGMDFLRLLQAEKLDYTTSFRRLIDENHWQAFRDDCIDVAAFDQFIERYQRVISEQPLANRQALMQENNPVYILRNHMAQQAIEKAEQDDFSEVDRLYQLLTTPYTPQPDIEQENDLLPPFGEEVAVSCSS
ncbi:protein adenylyltransferase SelO [Alkanindiges illinoisensis]|uniref:Protein nucleotidyltransferase YdiU n=1 Tax=Alkanindiges illinoisensis TaxID=197183 RepID=A0A4Y7XAM6_9GAMM|nr:YdiU family protein [Alkanindiges illinoisensis]TEU24727.1 YdiU family protein [Alkanindiges illinoisensis]